MLKNNYLRLIQYSAVLALFCIYGNGSAQIQYQNVSNKNVALGSYGRVGVDWSFVNEGAIGRRLNLNNMGSIGGRMEEQDYLELVPAFHFKPKEGDSTQIIAQLRFSFFSTSLTTFGNSTSSSLGGLTFAMPEAFVEARNIHGKDLSMWIGARLYRGADIHITDYFYFNDHSSQGFGIEFKNTRMAMLFVSSTDTASTLPPFFYLNIKTGTPSAALRQRSVYTLEQDLIKRPEGTLTFLGEYHRMANADSEEYADTANVVFNFPSDQGFVAGLRYNTPIKSMIEGSYNDISLRYGTGIANGGDGGMSRTWLTYGAPDTIALSFEGARSIAFTEQFLFNLSPKNALHGYIIVTDSKGAAPTDGMSKSYFGKEVYNRKQDLTFGARHEHFFTDFFHLLSEVHYSQRKDGTNPIANVVKVSVSPVFVPTGIRDTWARPHLRFVATLARYNDFAKETLYSPYLQLVGQERWGYYFGVKAEWWIWN